MTAGSGAKVLAAWADPATQRALLPEATFTERALLDVRRRGWAQSVAEREAGVASVSAPVRDAAGTVVAAVSVSGPVDRIGRRPGRAVGGGPAGGGGRACSTGCEVPRPPTARRRSVRPRGHRGADRRGPR